MAVVYYGLYAGLVSVFFHPCLGCLAGGVLFQGWRLLRTDPPVALMGIVADLWKNQQFLDDFTPDEKYIFLYCLTNPHRSFCGCYEITITQIARKTGLRRVYVRSVPDRLQRVYKVLVFNDSTAEMLLVDWIEDS